MDTFRTSSENDTLKMLSARMSMSVGIETMSVSIVTWYFGNKGEFWKAQ